jgi:hypothetical protein
MASVQTQFSKNHIIRVKEKVAAWTSSQKSLSARVRNKKQRENMKKTLLLAAALMLGAALNASAVLINYSVGGAGPFVAPPAGNDIATLLAYSGTLNLTLGIAQVGDLNAVDYTIGNNNGDSVWPFTATRTMSVSIPGVASGLVSQGLDMYIRSASPYDQLTADAGATVHFNLGAYDLAVTPLAFATGGETDYGLNVYDWVDNVNSTYGPAPHDGINGTFLLTRLPQYRGGKKIFWKMVDGFSRKFRGVDLFAVQNAV